MMNINTLFSACDVIAWDSEQNHLGEVGSKSNNFKVFLNKIFKLRYGFRML